MVGSFPQGLGEEGFTGLWDVFLVTALFSVTRRTPIFSVALSSTPMLQPIHQLPRAGADGPLGQDEIIPL